MYDDKKIGTHTTADLARMDFRGALGVLRQAAHKGTHAAYRSGDGGEVWVKLRDVVTLPNVFQYRTDLATEDERKQQSKRLTHALSSQPKGKQSLDPILVMAVEDHWVCLDGHHRVEAYAAAKVSPIKALVFEGSVDEALLEAGASNAKTKLAMTPRERQDAAWRLTAATQHSIKRVAEATGTSKRQVSYMREIRKKLEAMGEDPTNYLRWLAAKGAAEDTEQPERDEDWEDQQVMKFEKRLRKEFGKHVHQNRVIMAAALENLYPSLVDEIIERNVFERRAEIEQMFKEDDESEF